MYALEQPDLVKLIHQLAEIVSTAELSSGRQELTQQLSDMEQTASAIERAVWYQRKIVCDVRF